MTFSTPQAIHQQCAFRAANAAMAAALKRDSQLTRFRLPRTILIQLSMFVVSKPPSKHLLTHNETRQVLMPVSLPRPGFAGCVK
jgi:hypothetical protein